MILQTLSSPASAPPGLKRAFQYLQTHDLTTTAPGRIEIDGPRCFAVVQEYRTAPVSQCHLEGHQKYWDVQCILSGQERIFVTSSQNSPPVLVPYNPGEDILFFFDPPEPCSQLILHAGEIAVFSPDDLHKTRCDWQDGSSCAVKKVIIKVAASSQFIAQHKI